MTAAALAARRAAADRRSAPASPALTSPVSIGPRPADEAQCVRLAASPGTGADTLRALASHDQVTVRAAVAMNPSTPRSAYAALAGDADVRVRQLLGHRLATLIPGLSDSRNRALLRHVTAALRRLVDDEAERVRRTIAEIVRDMPAAPRELILRLARDTEMSVCEPVLRLSPVLTSADLLALLASPPARRTTAAIASRPHLAADVAGAIAAGVDAEAICSLLENGSAQLQEAALDALASRAKDHRSWHEPMVRRPKLSDGAAAALSEIVTTHLLAVLAERCDLAADVTARLKQLLQGRPAIGGPLMATPEEALAQARALHADGRLDEAAIRAAALQGDARLCAAMLAVLAELPLGMVERATSLRSAKGIVSLAWLGRLPMELAVTLQILVGRVAPDAVLREQAGAGFPLAESEMRWQIELLTQMETT